ncbi:Os01g0188525 [Oryza sativa Japonica Group]|uniref:Os01g0188525 protein n=1 Tax=Oryza sativa subsp. japonica TaxID=39947 RepID=A0A0P0UZS9_ORYSJ|nr:hypothetical protein EE612_000735 [Oryza sativa]BAS70803.1 Os01g0188525 [Oryza sativa Japonica Group]
MFLSGQFLSTSRTFPLECTSTDIETLWLSKYAPILLAGLTYCWCIHHREKLLHIINQKLVEEPLVPLLKIHHGHVTLQRYTVLAKIMHDLLYLKILRHNCRRKKAT